MMWSTLQKARLLHHMTRMTLPFDTATVTVHGLPPRRSCTFNNDRPTRQVEEPPLLEKLTIGAKVLKRECGRFVNEWKEHFIFDLPNFYPGEIVPQYKFDSQEVIDSFTVVTDSDNNHGFSKAEFTPTRNGTAVFKGVLDKRLPKDGRTKYAGLASILSKPKTKSFHRQVYFDWLHWTHLVIRCRGDGRSYMVHLTVYGDYDVQWYMAYHYPLYTRGGPYWQLTYIPFSKFYLINKGRLQDKQGRIPLSHVRKVGITCGDGNSGPFELEIDFIGCTMTDLDVEHFAYEKYETPDGYSLGF